MKKIIAIATIAASAFVMTGCSSINQGRITEKVFTDEREWYESKCVKKNDTGSCVQHKQVKKETEETYRFNLRQGDKTGWVYVNENDYNKHNVNDCWGQC